MDIPTVVILEESDFQRRLMADLVTCNDLEVIAGTDLDSLDKPVAWGRAGCVVVVDLELPGRAGIRALQDLRTLPGRFKPRVIALTSDGQSPPVEVARVLGFDELLVRPIDIGEFSRTVLSQARLAVAAEQQCHHE